MAKRLVACLISILTLLFIFSAVTLAQDDGPPPPPPPGTEGDVDFPPAPPDFDDSNAPPAPPAPTTHDQDLSPAPDGNSANSVGGTDTGSATGNAAGNNGFSPADSSSGEGTGQSSASSAQAASPQSASKPKPASPAGAADGPLPDMEATVIQAVDSSMNWPMFRNNPRHAGLVNEKLEFPLKHVWKQVAKLSLDEARSNIDNPSSPAVVDGVIYFCSARRLYAVNADTGSLRWVYPAEGSLNAMVKSSPLVYNDLVYFGGGDGRLYAITKESGKLAWSFTTKGIMNSSPVLADDTLFVGSSDDNLYALDPVTGQQKWRSGFRTHDDIAGSPAVSNGLVYFLSNDMVLYAAYTTTGRLKWVVRVGASSKSTTPVVSGNNIYVGIGNVLQCIQSQSGRLVWGAPMPGEITTIPAISDKAIYFACRNKFYALTLSGKSKWKTPVDLGSIAIGSPTIAGDTIILGTSKGIVWAIDSETGSVKWKYMVSPATLEGGKLKYAGLSASPVVSNGTLYLLSDDGTLSAFRSDMPDNTPPYVSSVSPSRDYLMPGTPPVEIAAIVSDSGSGLNSESIELLLDGVSVKHNFIPESGTVWYRTVKTQPIRPLPDGRHIMTLLVSDWAGNKTKTMWSFNVDNSIRVAPDAKKKDQQTPGMPGMGGMPGMPGMPGMGGGMGGMMMPGMPGMGGR
ncbi:MAG: outer membrane protein assembly factor BamB family protein [Armatimonadota bacterium]